MPRCTGPGTRFSMEPKEDGFCAARHQRTCALCIRMSAERSNNRRGANRLLTPSSPHLVDKEGQIERELERVTARRQRATPLQIGAERLRPRPFGSLGCVPEHASRPVDLNSQVAFASQIPVAVPLPALFHLSIRGQAAGAQLARPCQQEANVGRGANLRFHSS